MGLEIGLNERHVKEVLEKHLTPSSRPHEYEPRYGAFTITINPDEED